jgi:DNA-binding CsgD family transcriptional regulator
MARAVRRRNAGYQRMDQDDVRASLTSLTGLFAEALAGAPADQLHASLKLAITRRLRQGLHTTEVYGAWLEARWVLELHFADEPLALELLDEMESTVTQQLREGVQLRATPAQWPAQEVRMLRRTLGRAMVALELLEETAGHQLEHPLPKAALTRRERDILTSAAAGLTNERIAEGLNLSPATVRTYLSRAADKLGAVNRVHAVSVGVSLGIVSPNHG